MDNNAHQVIKHYLVEVENNDRNKKISPMTVPESHAAALKLVQKLPADLDEQLVTLFFSHLFGKGGLFREIKSIDKKHYPSLMAGLKHRILDAGGKKMGFLDEMELRFTLGVGDLKKAVKARGIPLRAMSSTQQFN